MTDTLWSDVSEWQVPVDDSYPYQVLAIRSNDGTYADHVFAQNYRWACAALDSGRLKILIIYIVYRPNWAADLATLKSQVGEPHSGVVVMLDVESWGGEILGDQSDGINRLYWGIADWLGTASAAGTRRVIGYGNVSDLTMLWPTRPAGLGLVIAAYGSNPDFAGKLAHQFTNGAVGGPISVAPFGWADVNSADGYDVDQLARAFGLENGGTIMTSPDALAALGDIREQLCGKGARDAGSGYPGWEQLGGRTLVDGAAEALAGLAALAADVAAIKAALIPATPDAAPAAAPVPGVAQ